MSYKAMQFSLLPDLPKGGLYSGYGGLLLHLFVTAIAQACYCTRMRATFENWMRPEGAVPPLGGSTYFSVFISFASDVPYRNAAVIEYSPGTDGALSI